MSALRDKAPIRCTKSDVRFVERFSHSQRSKSLPGYPKQSRLTMLRQEGEWLVDAQHGGLGHVYGP